MPLRRIVVVAVALALGLMIADGPPLASSPTSDSRMSRPFSAIPLHHDVVKDLKAKGRQLPSPFPNSANQGRKFNPTGDLVGPLETPEQQRVLVLFIRPSGQVPGGPASRLDLATYFDTMLFGTTYSPPEYLPYASLNYPTDRTLYNYFQEVSYGNIDVVTVNLPSSLGWLSSEYPYSQYCEPDGTHDYGFGPYPRNAAGLVAEAIQLANPVVDFGAYAVNGEVPNLFVVHAGTGAEWSSDPSLIWSHSWSLSAATGLPVPVDGVIVDNYAIMPEVGGDTTGFLGNGAQQPYPPTVGVYAHEYGHVLGLPDQYDYGYESEGTGMLSLMAGGSWNAWPYRTIFWGNSPSHLDAWSKYRLGVLDPTVITTASAVTLPPVETADVAYKMVVPNSGGREYFLLENRQPIGFDKGLLYAFRSDGMLYTLPVHDLAIYHIDDGVLTRNYWYPNEAENWKEFRSEGWRRAWTGESHYGISLIQADGWRHLERGWNYGDPGDLFPGLWGVTSFGNGTSPNSSSYYFWGGSTPRFGYSGVTVDGVAESGGVVTATLSFNPWTPGRR